MKKNIKRGLKNNPMKTNSNYFKYCYQKYYPRASTRTPGKGKYKYKSFVGTMYIDEVRPFN